MGSLVNNEQEYYTGIKAGFGRHGMTSSQV